MCSGGNGYLKFYEDMENESEYDRNEWGCTAQLGQCLSVQLNQRSSPTKPLLNKAVHWC